MGLVHGMSCVNCLQISTHDEEELILEEEERAKEKIVMGSCLGIGGD